MAIDIIVQQQDEVDPTTWYIKIGGIAADGNYKLADLTITTGTTPADWLATHQAEAQAAIDAGVINQEFTEKLDLGALAAQVNSELTWLASARAEIGTIQTDIVNARVTLNNATLAVTRGVVDGILVRMDAMLQQMDRMHQEEIAELKAMRYIVRRLVS